MTEPIPIPQLLPCPFCGADAEASWVMEEKWGKSMRVRCSRDGECPSPKWLEAARDHEDDATCVASVVGFWNTRAADWAHGWNRPSGRKPKGEVLVYKDRLDNEAMAGGPPYAIARWQKGKWRDTTNGRIYRVLAWRRLVEPPWGMSYD